MIANECDRRYKLRIRFDFDLHEGLVGEVCGVIEGEALVMIARAERCPAGGGDSAISAGEDRLSPADQVVTTLDGIFDAIRSIHRS